MYTTIHISKSGVSSFANKLIRLFVCMLILVTENYNLRPTKSSCIFNHSKSASLISHVCGRKAFRAAKCWAFQAQSMESKRNK